MRIAGTQRLQLILKYPPEMRFTPGGKSVCILEDIGKPTLRFEAWEDAIGDLIELPALAAIDVGGYQKTREYNGQRYAIFIITSWNRRD